MRKYIVISIFLVFLSPWLILSNFGPPKMELVRSTFDNFHFLASSNEADTAFIFVHGTPGDASNFKFFIDNPPEGIKVYSLDRQGYGSASDSKVLCSYEKEASYLIEFVESVVQEKRVFVAGHSYGAPIVVAAGLSAPDLFSGVLVLAGAFDPALESPRWYNYLGRMFMLPSKWKKGNQEMFCAEHSVKWLADELGKFMAPLSVIHGVEDDLVEVANVEFLSEKVKSRKKRINLLQGGSHFLPWRNQKEILEEMRWLAQ